MIVVFGSVNLDIVTPVARIAGPGETVLGPSYSAIPGGKGANQALAARRAGATVAMAGAVGTDGFAAPALALLEEAGVDLSALHRSPDRPTGAAFIAVDESGQNAITVAAGANAAARGDSVEALGLKEGDLLLLQREVPDAENMVAARLAKAEGARVILNLAPAGALGEDDLLAVDILVANEHEAAFLAGTLGLAATDYPALAAHLAEEYGTDLVVTLGAEGARGWFDGDSHAVPSLPIRPVDTTAAGDTFVGAFAAALAAGQDPAEALRHGAVAGSLACLTAGAQPSIPSAAAIRDALG